MRYALLAITVLAACAQPPAAEPPPQQTASTAHALVGTRWVEHDAGPDATRIEFTTDRASGYTGCNSWSSGWSATGPALTFEGVSTTERACEPGLMEIEQGFLANLGDTQMAQVEDGQLVLRDIGGAEIARYDPAS